MTMEPTLVMVPTKDLMESPLNPRKHYDTKKLEELTDSVRANGVRVPLIVRPKDGVLEIGAGHRRKRAADAAGLERVPAIVQDLDDQAFLELLTFENLEREDIHPLEEAEGYRQLIQLLGYTAEAIAARIGKDGKSVSYVYQRLKLLDLIGPAREAFLQDKLTAGHAVLLARLAPEDQKEGFNHAVDGTHGRGMSVRELAAWIQEHIVRDLGRVPWDLEDGDLVTKAGSCTQCPKRAGSSPELWADLAKGDRCMDRTCFEGKLQAFIVVRRLEAKKEGGKVVELSASHGYSGNDKKAHPSRLWPNDWRRAGAQKCDHVATGVVMEGGYGKNEPQIGDLIQVCTNPDKCKVHSGRSERSEPSAADKRYRTQEKNRREKEKVNRALRRRIFDAVRDKVKGPLGTEDLRLVAEALYEGGGYDAAVIIDEIYEWPKNAPRAKTLDAVKTADLPRLIVELALCLELDGPVRASKGDLLLEAAKRYRIDVKKLEKAMKAEAADGDDAE